MSLRALLMTALWLAGTAAHANEGDVAPAAIASFNAVCFNAGQTADRARERMGARDGTPLPTR